MGFLHVSDSYFKESTCRSAPWKLLVSPENELIAIDFGCMKIIPMDFYTPYFELAKPACINDPVLLSKNYTN